MFVPVTEASAVPKVAIRTLTLYLKLLVYPSPTLVSLAMPALAVATIDVGDCGMFAPAKQDTGSVCVTVPPVAVAVQVVEVARLPKAGRARRTRLALLNKCVIQNTR